jgi:hypothetical protein
MAHEITSTSDFLDVRDIIERVEELEESEEPEDAEELAPLQALLDTLAGTGGDHEWRGQWYPVTLIRDSHFETYARELAEDIGAIRADAQWPLTCIDWEKAAWELQTDYTSVEFDGVTYWYR